MKQTTWMCVGLMLASPAALSETTPIEKREDVISYTYGYQIGQNLKAQSLEINRRLLELGLSDAFENAEPKTDLQKAQAMIQEYQQEQHQMRQVAMQKEAEENLSKGMDFLATNKAKEGVITLDSGLQYKVLKEGSGDSPSKTDTVTTHYKGTLINGQVFDSSYDRGQPASFPVNGVIAGWTEALQLMKVGAKWQLFIPPELAYGQRGAGRSIPPNATLIFDVELLDINK